MPRSVAEWIGKTDDAPVPPRVRLRVFERENGKCHACRRKIRPGEKWTCEHVIALENHGPNRESNLALTCSNCLPNKNAADAAEKSKTYAVRSKHTGAVNKGRGFQTNRNGRFKKHMDGRVSMR